MVRYSEIEEEEFEKIVEVITQEGLIVDKVLSTAIFQIIICKDIKIEIEDEFMKKVFEKVEVVSD